MLAILKTMLLVAIVALAGAVAVANGTGSADVGRGSAANYGVHAPSIYSYADFNSNSMVAAGQGPQVYINGGDGVFSGSVTAQAFVQGLRTREGGLVGASVSLTPLATIEDSGTARLERGEGVVRLDPTLARTIDFRYGYQVFLTPDGETRGLYVAAKYERGFVVRENERGRSNSSFDYRILAHPVGTNEVRLPDLNAVTNPG